MESWRVAIASGLFGILAIWVVLPPRLAILATLAAVLGLGLGVVVVFVMRRKSDET